MYVDDPSAMMKFLVLVLSCIAATKGKIESFIMRSNFAMFKENAPFGRNRSARNFVYFKAKIGNPSSLRNLHRASFIQMYV